MISDRRLCVPGAIALVPNGQTRCVPGEFRRRWVLAPLGAGPFTSELAVLRNSTPEDDPALVNLLDAAYTGTIDFDPDADHADELRTWRGTDGGDDRTSSVAEADGRIVGACLIGRDLGAPFLYEIVVEEPHRRGGLARALLRRSVNALVDQGEESVAGWVTEGNVASERLLGSQGFVPVTPAVDERVGLGYYRAARVLASLDVSPDVPAAATSDADGPTLWVMDGSGRDDTSVAAGATSVRIKFIDRTDPSVPHLAETALPITQLPWLLRQRAPLAKG